MKFFRNPFTKAPSSRAAQASAHALTPASPALPYASQPRAVRRHFASALARGLAAAHAQALSRGGYKVVRGADQENRPLAVAEQGGEDRQLTQTERNRIIAFARKLVRNSDQMAGILNQFDVNVVGTVGGKAVFDFGSDNLDDPIETAVTDAFADWARRCEFFDDSSLNQLLKLALKTRILGGDLVLVFDDGLVEDSGQVIVFEPDCIGNLSPSDFETYFPGMTQSQGIVKNPNGKTVGVIVSWSQRGRTTYSLTDAKGRLAAWPLLKPADQDWRDSLFILHRHVWRFNQGHGSSSLWAALATLCDLTDLQGFEIQSAKKNAQTIGQITKTAEAKDGELDKELNPDMVVPINDGEAAGAQAPGDTDEDEQIDADFQALKAAGCVYELMPEGVRMELLDTKHPNSNMPQFITWLQRVAAYTQGLSAFHATGKADSSYSATMAEIQLSQKSFDDAWHDLEAGILDWIMERWFRWALRTGHFPVAPAALPSHWQRKCVKWERPAQKALNPVDEQRAHTEGLRNGSIDYVDIHGANWKRRAAQRARQKKFISSLGLRYFPETDNNGMTENPAAPEPAQERD